MNNKIKCIITVIANLAKFELSRTNKAAKELVEFAHALFPGLEDNLIEVKT